MHAHSSISHESSSCSSHSNISNTPHFLSTLLDAISLVAGLSTVLQIILRFEFLLWPKRLSFRQALSRLIIDLMEPFSIVLGVGED